MNNNINNSLQNTCNTCNLNPEEHLKYVDSLVSLKIIDENTGKSIKQNMTAKFGNNGAVSAFSGADMPFDIKQSEFLKARECLLNYLLNSGIELDEGSLKDIEAVVLELEKMALMREQGNALEALKKNNEIAKERLMTGSMQGGGAQTLPNKLFTREEIGKMSTAEFIKNEPTINYQLQNGLL